MLSLPWGRESIYIASTLSGVVTLIRWCLILPHILRAIRKISFNGMEIKI